MKKTRNSNIELLRLVLMAFVVLLHFNNDTMGGAFVLVKDLHLENTILRLLEAFCNHAVNCFMIVSGYFLYTNNKIKFGKVFDILAIVIFYNYLNLFCEIIFLNHPFSIRRIIGCILPANYFAIFYVICYILSPFVAKCFRDISFKSVNLLMAMLSLIFIVIPTFLDIANDLHIFKDPGFLSPISLIGNGGGYTIVQFFVMLSLGMWIRKTDFSSAIWKLLLTYAVSSLAIFICQKKISAYNYDFIFNVTAATSIFLLFNKFKFQNKVINFASKSCFAIFCIHTSAFANTIWRQYFITKEHIQNGTSLAVLWMLISVSVMFCSCLAISFIMRGIFCKVKFFIANKLSTVEIEN